MELILEDVRCFAGEHTNTIKPLTILVGENSSGKSTFLAALSAVCDPVGFPMQPSFNEAPYSLGGFDTIATYKGGSVDNDVAHRVFLKADDPDFKHVYACLFGKRLPVATIVYGGQLEDEYLGNQSLIAPLLELSRAGRVKVVARALVESEKAAVTAKGLCRSNDSHIIALARIAKVGLLCSANPRGKVYKYASHRKLLPQFC